jgi:hypothetical protein
MLYRRSRTGPWAAAFCGLVLGLVMLFAPNQGAAAVGTASQYAAAVAGGVGQWQLIKLRPPAPPDRARPPGPHPGGRAASSPKPASTKVPPGLSFTTAHGCNPAADWRSQRLDRRVRALVRAVAAKHAIRLSCARSGHSRFVKHTTRVSNHTVWRAVDVDVVDGRPVSGANQAARQLALDIGSGKFGVQPSEVGSPWDFARRPYFTDEGHQGHLHVGFSA